MILEPSGAMCRTETLIGLAMVGEYKLMNSSNFVVVGEMLDIRYLGQ